MVNDAFEGGSDGLEASMRVRWKPRNAITVIHSVLRIGVEVLAVPYVWCFHFSITSRISILVINAE